jgi:CHASE3 domain sensor protein
MNIKLLAQAMGIGEADLKAMIEQDGKLPEGEELETALAATLKDHIANVKKAQHQRGVKETFKKVTAKIKSEWSDAPEDITDDMELLTQFAESKTKGGGNTGDKETLAKDPIVKGIVSEAVAAQKAKFAEMEATFKKTLAQRESEMAATVAAGTMQAILDKHKVILGEDEATQKARIETIGKLVGLNRIGLKDGKPVILDEDGETVATDDAGRPITYEAKVLEAATPFGFHKQDPGKKGAGANGGGGNGGDGGGKQYQFADEASLNEFLNQTHDPKVRAEAMKAFMAAEATE